MIRQGIKKFEGARMSERYKQNVNTIDLTDFFLSFLMKWRLLLLMSIAGAILFGGYGTWKIIKTSASVPVISPDLQRGIEVIGAMDGVREQINRDQVYLADSLFAKIDPANEQVIRQKCELRLEPGQEAFVGILLDACSKTVLTGAWIESAADSLDTAGDYIKELVSSENGMSVTDPGTGKITALFTFKIIAPDLDTAEACYQALTEELQNKDFSYLGISTQVELVFEEPEKTTAIDNNVSNQIAAKNNEIYNLGSTLSSYQTTFDNVLLKLEMSSKEELQTEYEAIKAASEAGTGRPVSLKEALLSSIRTFILGFASGFLLILILTFFSYAGSSTIPTAARFFKVFPDIRRLGTLDSDRSRRNLPLDRYLRRKRGDSTFLGKEVSLDLIGENILNTAEKADESLVLTGMAGKGRMEELFRELEQKISGACAVKSKESVPSVEHMESMKRMEFVFAPDILHDPRALSEIRKADAVILVEERGVSSYTDIQAELGLVENAGAKVLGAVII